MSAAANPISLDSRPRLKGYHIYHAEAELLSGKIEQPIKQPIKPIGQVVLQNTRSQSLRTQSVGETNIEGLISFKSGHTRVIGTQLDYKKDIFGTDHSGWATQATAVLEGYSVLDLVTVDRVVAQVTTDHAPRNGNESAPYPDVPSVSFLGSTFGNLRIGGFPVEVELDLNFCPPKPASGKPHLLDESFGNSIQQRLDDFRKEIGDDRETSGALEEGYQTFLSKEDAEGGRKGYPKRRCSLVKKIKLPIPIPGVKVFGNLIFIPGFGVVSLAEVEIGQEEPTFDTLHRGSDKPKEPAPGNYFKLHMFRMNLGCGTTSSSSGPTVTTNGHGGTGG